MKPTGPIPPAFAGQSRLTVGGQDFADLMARAGDSPAFLYDMGAVAARIARLRVAMPEGVGIHYAIKANPHRELLALMAPMVDGLDVASGGELTMALSVIAADAISFAGPGKRDDELAAAVTAGATLHIESEGEADRALAIGERLGKAPRIAVRVNPDFELRGSGMRMGGRASQFGIDAVRVPALVRRLVATGADWHGFHIFAGSQTLDTVAIIETQAATVALAARLAEEAGGRPAFVNLGGGFGIPYFAGDHPVDVEATGTALADVLVRRAPVLSDTHFAIELGRWLVGEAGVYCTRVVDIKQSGGEWFVIVDGGLHHQLAASGNFGTVVRRNYPVAVADRMDAPPEMTASIVGCLCTPLDRLADRVALPVVGVGDTIVLFQAGAYGATASPQAFLGHPAPRELVVS
ncbi:pyridoxal-dependent decarboxylase, exosortase A system-associated [Sphingomonas sp. CFBP 13720]|uniref:pyridoxal-dependent decarboxylase, exosortase A system-associated n=1 Tax=Sphingomonas sp. CFBP 13720 TaxID=2775302 RepID=UPI00177C736A|nr:pyridoxal-dependent decarboxylase, exosortase A system-associated [Sphingomonas sp. CFBP 13720]MBD8676972.1 pyridoxal-dependent decarboxylase, exosortase A system-associated [Sphingomonas sp. CFBP 13720]